MADELYKPGDPVAKSGLYAVSHQQHRPEHEATLFEGEEFPACGQCGEEVRFRLLRTAVPISNDSDFKARKARSHSRGHR